MNKIWTAVCSFGFSCNLNWCCIQPMFACHIKLTTKTLKQNWNEVILKSLQSNTVFFFHMKYSVAKIYIFPMFRLARKAVL